MCARCPCLQKPAKVSAVQDEALKLTSSGAKISSFLPHLSGLVVTAYSDSRWHGVHDHSETSPLSSLRVPSQVLPARELAQRQQQSLTPRTSLMQTQHTTSSLAILFLGRCNHCQLMRTSLRQCLKQAGPRVHHPRQGTSQMLAKHSHQSLRPLTAGGRAGSLHKIARQRMVLRMTHSRRHRLRRQRQQRRHRRPMHLHQHKQHLPRQPQSHQRSQLSTQGPPPR